MSTANGIHTNGTATALTIVEQVKTVEVDIVRHEHFYFYNRRENGHSVVTAERIPPQRAREIYEANRSNDEQRTIGRVDFDRPPCEWSWTTRFVF